MTGFGFRGGKRLWPDRGVIRVAWEYSPKLDRCSLHGIAHNPDANGWRIVTTDPDHTLGVWWSWAFDNRTFRTTQAARQRLLRHLQKDYTEGLAYREGDHLCLMREEDYEAVTSRLRIETLYREDVMPWIRSRPRRQMEPAR